MQGTTVWVQHCCGRMGDGGGGACLDPWRLKVALLRARERRAPSPSGGLGAVVPLEPGPKRWGGAVQRGREALAAGAPQRGRSAHLLAERLL